MKKIGLETPHSQLVTDVEGGLWNSPRKHGYPIILRPSFTMGGSGGGIAYNREDLVERFWSAASIFRPCTKCSSKRARSAGRNSSWK
jgi:carbamoylphosphate synthase large subunit